MYHGAVIERLLQYVAEHELIRPGDRVALAVSGGADSVALLRLLLEVRGDLGIVLSVAHFNHKIRGADADADESFVRDLASKYDLPFRSGSADTPEFARQSKLGLEAAARQLRHDFFRDLMREGFANKIATAHTLDDQAETVLLRLMRGAGTKGMAGVYPELRLERGSILRPLLQVRREDLRDYLRAVGQDWREDASNTDLAFMRNRVRHKLLPLIEAEFGAATLARLAETAEIARAEEEYWIRQIALFTLSSQGAGTHDIDLPCLLREPVALRRRVIRAHAQALGHSLDFLHVELICGLANQSHRGSVELPNGLRVSVQGTKLRFRTAAEEERFPPFAHRIILPAEVRLPQLDCTLRFRLVEASQASQYARENRLSQELQGSEVVLRNWRPGDRFWPLHSKSDKKVKELLTAQRVPSNQRSLWPVAEHKGELVWVRGLPVSRKYSATEGQAAIVVEVVQ